MEFKVQTDQGLMVPEMQSCYCTERQQFLLLFAQTSTERSC